MARGAYLRFSLMAAGLGLLAACAGPGTASTDRFLSQQALHGATPQILATDFGPPMLRRIDGPDEVWLYQTPACTLDVFLYPDNTGKLRVGAVLPDDGANPQRCLQSLTHVTTAASLERNAAS